MAADGLCECGCGRRTTTYLANNLNKGHVRGEHRRWVQGHNTRGDAVRNYKGGRTYQRDYVMALIAYDDPFIEMAVVGRNKTSYVPEHRLMMARHLGRPLEKEETVHHKNGVRDDNRLENLELWSSRHPKGQRIDDLLEWAHGIIDLYEGGQ